MLAIDKPAGLLTVPGRGKAEPPALSALVREVAPEALPVHRLDRDTSGVLLIAIIFGVATVIVRANAGPPGYIRWQNLPQSLKDGKDTSGGLMIEVIPGDDNMKLIIPLRKSGKPGEE